MSEARKRILNMLAQGKISVEQSEELLSAIEADERAQRETSGKSKIANGMTAFAQQFQKQVSETVKGTQPHVREIKSKLKELSGWFAEKIGTVVTEFSSNREEPSDGIPVEFMVPEPENFAAIKLCDITNLFGSISVSEGSDFSLKVTGHISKSALDEQNPQNWFLTHAMTVKNETLIIGLERKTPNIAVLNLEFLIPNNRALKFRTVSAAIDVNGVFSIEGAQTVSGAISFQKANLLDAMVEAISGDLNILDGRASGDFKTTSGNIIFKDSILETLTGHTVSGEIHMINSSVDGNTNIAIYSTSGDISIKAPKGNIRRVEASSRTGFIQKDWTNNDSRPLRPEVLFDSQDQGAIFKVETTSGDIQFEKFF